MSLPKLAIATHALHLPTSKKDIEFRQWTVGEEKLLFMAAEKSASKADMYQAIKQVLTSCTLNKIDIESLPASDVEYLIIKLRARSADNLAKFTMKCSECQTGHPQTIDLSTIEPINLDTSPSNKIMLDERTGIKLKCPTYKDAIAEDVDTIRACVECIFTSEEVFFLNDFTSEEIDEFFAQLTKPQVDDITAYYNSLPRLESTLEFECRKCNHPNKYTLRGIGDFFQ